jgi:hypothetical protein
MVTPFDAEIPGVANADWIVHRDGSVAGFTWTGTIAIDGKGHVVAGARSFVTEVAVEDHALGRDASGSLWQTTDGGATWVEVEPPPVDLPPVARSLHPEVPNGKMQCGPVGCVLAHPSGVGSWLRIGWPSDPPVRTASRPEAIDAGARAAASAKPIAPAPKAPAPRLPKLVCTVKADLKPRSEGPPLGASGNGEERIEMIGGQRVAKGPLDRERVVAMYRDRFDGPVGGFEASSIEHALRAALRFEVGTVRDGRWILAASAPIEGYYVETFDPMGRIRHVVGSPGRVQADPAGSTPASSSDAAKGAAARAPDAARNAYRERDDHPARPVLAAGRSAEAAGVLVRAGDRTVWIMPSGHVRAVASCRSHLEPFGGVVDARGKLWIACEDYSRAVDVIDAETGKAQLQLPSVLPWAWEPEVRMPLYGGGRSTFLANPDSVAVGADGKLAVLRLPSEAPATVDDPAWLLTPDGPPVELAPWSALQPATSPDCSRSGDAYRVLVQTAVPWIDVDGSLGFRRRPGMTALVRWGRERVCLEAVELGYREIEDTEDSQFGVQVMVVARFAGHDVAAGLVGMTRSDAYRAPATCRLDTGS